MNDRITIYDYQILDIIYQVLLLLFSLAPIFSTVELFESELLNKIISYIFIVFILGLIKLSNRTSIYNGFVIKEIYSNFFGTLKTIKKFRVSEIEEIFLNQNDELYFEITAKMKNNEKFILNKLPNKNPALKELELIKGYFRIT
ncbi:hypothetical protein [Winogradskyella sp. MH6]|uniref:hypothetical protein n=1 Tax=Winogradskyella sp. MH6 TaxID=2929510 RepID=UPI001FB38333|nr:hypothetical protein [Winogradskyella sp. MH6]